MRSAPLVSALLGAALVLVACGGDEPAEQDEPSCVVQFADEEGAAFERLSEYCFFEGPLADHNPADGVTAYDVAAELYADRSKKRRFIVLPDGETIGFDETEPWTWPDDAILVKTFYYPIDMGDPEAGEQILETRLLHKRDAQWVAETYMWDEDQKEAYRDNTGRRVDVSFIDDDGQEVEINYRIPNRNHCSSCHAQDGDIKPLGPRTRQLGHAFEKAENEPSQLERFDEIGLFDRPLPDISSLPSVVDPHDESASVEDRARAYLDANCAHCHNQDGRASSSGLYLHVDVTHQGELGICKSPIAAGGGSGGLPYDIVPGDPDQSIMIYRMESSESSVKMPELPITTVHQFGVDLVRDWISQMEPTGCD